MSEKNFFDSNGQLSGVEDVLKKYVPEKERAEVERILYGWNQGKSVESIEIPKEALSLAEKHDFEIKAFRFTAEKEEIRPPRIVRVALLQNSITNPTSDPLMKQYEGIQNKIEHMLDAAGLSGANMSCLQEAWTMPFAFCTREKHPWTQFAMDAETGPATVFCQKMAKKYNMVMVNPILERDSAHADTIWNTAVVIGNNGNVIGKSRKNHIPRVGDFNESTYYMEGNTGHQVFETAFGKIAVNICYGRHHFLNWMAYGLNGAEIVFNPSATVGALSEPMWGIEGRNAAIQNSYFTCNINRIGTETFPNEFTSGNAKPAHKDFGHFYGSSYVAAPDASRCPSLSRNRDGVLIIEMDLNLCTQIKDKWCLQMTSRYELYQEFLTKFNKPDFKPQVLRDPGLAKNRND